MSVVRFQVFDIQQDIETGARVYGAGQNGHRYAFSPSTRLLFRSDCPDKWVAGMDNVTGSGEDVNTY